ncbi:MAG TPA: beta-propeller fold lactonase family protein [Terriglobales bacterium]
MKFRALAAVTVITLGILALSCSSGNGTTASGTGYLFVSTQGNSTLTSYGIALSSGAISGITAIQTGLNPASIAINPDFTTIFVSNSGGNFVTTYAVNTDGSLSVGNNFRTGTTPMGLAVDPSGKFLFVANQKSNDVSVFTINGTDLAPVAGSPFTTIPKGTENVPTGPIAVAVPPAGNYIYVANQFTNTVFPFRYNAATGALTPLLTTPYPACAQPGVCIAPAALGISNNGNFLFVVNQGSNNVTSYALCVVVSATCPTPNGQLTQVGPPVAAGQGPISIASDPFWNFVYVADFASNQISQYLFSPGSGVLTPLSNPAISTGTSPVSITVISGQTGTYVGSTVYNLTDYAYVANNGGTSISIYTLNTQSGQLTNYGAPYILQGGQPSSVVAR